MKLYSYPLCLVVVTMAAGRASAQTQPAGTLASTSGPASQPATQPAPQPMPETARKAIAEKRYAEAARILEPLAAPEYAGFDVLLNLAGAYDALALEAAADRTPEARKACAEYSAKAVQNYLRAGNLALKARDPRAETILDRVLRYSPHQPDALLLLARLTSATSSTRAINHYKEYVTTSKGQIDYDAQVELGRLLVSEGLWRQAVDVLEKVQAAGGAQADQQLAQAYMAGQKTDKALEAANRAVDRDPQNPESYLVRSSLVLSIGPAADPTYPARSVTDLLNAVRLAREAVVASPEDEAVWKKLQNINNNGRHLLDAIKGQIKPQEMTPALRTKLAQIMGELGDLSRRLYERDALQFLTEGATAKSAATLDLLTGLARLQADAAVETAERILKQDPNNLAAKQIKESGKGQSK